jgi:hypothetical protein
MPTQAQIEKAAGIDIVVAEYIMKQETETAKAAMCMLKLCVDRYEGIAFTFLELAVESCKKEMGAR